MPEEYIYQVGKITFIVTTAYKDKRSGETMAHILRRAVDGYGPAETAAALEVDGIVNPTYYWRSKGVNRSGSKSTVEPTKWGHTTIKKILTLQEYCGDIINFKSYSKPYKMKKRIENPEENRAIFLNVHEAIIDRAARQKSPKLTGRKNSGSWMGQGIGRAVRAAL